MKQINKINILSVKIAAMALITALGITGMGCNPLTRTQKGTAIGAGAGATVGAVIGKAAGNTALGAIIGGAIGGTAGEFIGHTLDNQAAEIRRNLPGATVTREDDRIMVRFNSGLLFGVDSAELKPQARANLKDLAVTLKSHTETRIAIIGHTDSVGTNQHNIDLSVRRANAVRSFLMANGVRRSRLISEGEGEADPIASNATSKGRAKNRRVELVIGAEK